MEENNISVIFYAINMSSLQLLSKLSLALASHSKRKIE
jgi:hypothetical protein